MDFFFFWALILLASFIRKLFNFIRMTQQARSLPTDMLKIIYISINAALYIIQVSISFSSTTQLHCSFGSDFERIGFCLK